MAAFEEVHDFFRMCCSAYHKKDVEEKIAEHQRELEPLFQMLKIKNVSLYDRSRVVANLKLHVDRSQNS